MQFQVTKISEITTKGNFIITFRVPETTRTVTNAFGQRIFVLKTNANGTLLWATAFGSNSGLTARSVSVASDQKVYVTGGFNCAFDQMQTLPNMHEGFWNSLGYRDVYVLCLQANGNLAWSNRGFGKKDDLGLGAYVDWNYFEVVDTLSRLEGMGAYEGDMLYMDHMPFSRLFGFQLGADGANNKNTNFGMSGWIIRIYRAIKPSTNNLTIGNHNSTHWHFLNTRGLLR